MKEKVLSLILMMCVAVNLVSCSLPISGQIQGDSEPTTIVYLTVGDKPTNGQTEKVIEALNKILIDKINVKLDVYYISWTDYLEKYDQVLEYSDEQIDLIGTSTDWLDAWKNVTEGNFYPLTEDMLKQYCPETYASVSADEWESCKYEGNIYLIPENQYTQWTNHGFIYRGDLATEAGFEGGIHSWDDMTTFFKYVVKAYPNVIPWDADRSSTNSAQGYIVSKTDFVPILEITDYGLWGAYKDDLDTVVSPYYEGNELSSFANLMRKWERMGVFGNTEETSNDYTTGFYLGESACIEHHTNMYIEDRKPNMDIAQPGSRAMFFWFGEERGNIVRTSILHGAMAISARSQYPELALQTYELLRNDAECSRLINYGIEGQQYILEDGNIFRRPDSYNNDLDSITLNFWWGRRDDLALLNSARDNYAYEHLTRQYEQSAIDYPWEDMHFDMTGYSKELDKINVVCGKYLPMICYGDYDCTVDEIIKEFRQALKDAGFEEVTEYIQSQVDAREDKK